MDPQPVPSAPQRSTAWILGGGGVLSVLLMLRHPALRSHDIVEVIPQLVEIATANRFVHGALIAVQLLVLTGLLGFSRDLGWSSARVRVAAVCFAAGVACMTGAALTNGFVVTGIAETYARQPAAVLETLKPVLVLCHAANQALAQVGTVALSIAILCWSLVLTARGRGARFVGALGILVGLVPVVGLLSGRLPLDVHGMGVVVLAQALWYVAVAAWCASQRKPG
jgi:hypothetical protein